MKKIAVSHEAGVKEDSLAALKAAQPGGTFKGGTQTYRKVDNNMFTEDMGQGALRLWEYDPYTEQTKAIIFSHATRQVLKSIL